MQTRLILLLTLAALTLVPRAAHAESAYSLDELARTTSTEGRLRCPKLDMTKYRGANVRYHKPVYVYVDFKEQLTEFEATLVTVAKEVYGRAPRRIRHMGTYNCRRIRRFPDLLSEHALGNAIDVEGFDFGPAKGASQRKASPRKSLRRGFQVRVGKHWQGKRGAAAVHAEFLRKLTDRLIEDDVFRVLLGPAFPGHQDHFHFDVAPYRLVDL